MQSILYFIYQPGSIVSSFTSSSTSSLFNLQGLHENRPLHLHVVEPGNLAVLLAFHQDRANRLPEQTQRRVYSCAASALRPGGVAWRIFRWEGEPQRKAQKRPLRLYVYSRLYIGLHPNHRIYIRRYPSSRTAFNYKCTAPTRHGNRTNRIRPGKSVMSLSFPILPDSLNIPARYSVFLYIFGWACA